MSESKRILFFTVGIILVISIIGIGLSIYKKSKTTIDSSMNQYDALISQYDNITYSQYESGSARGDEIKRLITNMPSTADGISIIVKTNMATNSITYSLVDGKVSPALSTSIDDVNYINPNAIFTCKINRNANNMITSVEFTQK